MKQPSQNSFDNICLVQQVPCLSRNFQADTPTSRTYFPSAESLRQNTFYGGLPWVPLLRVLTI
jgi:hypothetical protein